MARRTRDTKGAPTSLVAGATRDHDGAEWEERGCEPSLVLGPSLELARASSVRATQARGAPASRS